MSKRPERLSAAAASSGEVLECGALVVATGGKSIPKMGATDFGYRLAAQFGVGSPKPAPPWCR